MENRGRQFGSSIQGDEDEVEIVYLNLREGRDERELPSFEAKQEALVIIKENFAWGTVTPLSELRSLILKCGICNVDWSTYDDGLKHMFDHSKIRCPTCFVDVNVLETHLVDHMKTHFNGLGRKKEHVRCSYCMVYECNYLKMWDHVIQEHLQTHAEDDDDDAPKIIKEVKTYPTSTANTYNQSRFTVQSALAMPPEITPPTHPNIGLLKPAPPTVDDNDDVPEIIKEIIVNPARSADTKSSIPPEAPLMTQSPFAISAPLQPPPSTADVEDELEKAAEPATLTSPKTKYSWKTTYSVSIPRTPIKQKAIVLIGDPPTSPETPGQINMTKPSECCPPKVPRMTSPQIQRRRVSGQPDGDDVTARIPASAVTPADQPQPNPNPHTITNCTPEKPPITTTIAATAETISRHGYDGGRAAAACHPPAKSSIKMSDAVESDSPIQTHRAPFVTPHQEPREELQVTISSVSPIFERVTEPNEQAPPNNVQRYSQPKGIYECETPSKVPKQKFMIQTRLLKIGTYKDRFPSVQKLSIQHLSKISQKCQPIFQQMNEMFFGNNAEQKLGIIQQSELLAPYVNNQKAFTPEQKLHIDDLMEEMAKELSNPCIQQGNANFKDEILRPWFPVMIYAYATLAYTIGHATADFVKSVSNNVNGIKPDLKVINKIFLATKFKNIVGPDAKRKPQ